MDDLISRQAVLNATSTTLKITGKENAETVYEYIKKLCDDIKALPSAQKKGHWVDGKRMKMDGTYYWFRQCSVCDYERNDDDSDKDTNFCPNCGADMRGDDDV